MATRAPPPDNLPWVRGAIVAFATLLLAITLYGLIRWLAGIAPPTPWVRNPAIAIHLIAVIPAIPLNAYVLFVRKGGPRHRWLGRLWVILMLVAAAATVFIHVINPGGYSWIHILTLVTLLTVPRAWIAARQRNFARHRRAMLTLYVAALLIAGFFTFLPGRTMWQWAFG